MAKTATHIKDSLSTTYAQALLEMVLAADVVDDVAEQVEQLRQLIDDQPELRRILGSRLLGTSQRAATIDRVFQGKVHGLLHQFLQVVNRKNRMHALPGILAAFEGLVEEHRGVQEVDAYVAVPLSEDDRRQVATAAGRAIGRNVTIDEHVDPALIGGLKLRVGDRLIDGSVATQLKLIRRKLVNAGREDARTRTHELLGE